MSAFENITNALTNQFKDGLTNQKASSWGSNKQLDSLIDRTEQRSYVEKGFFTPGGLTDINTQSRQITWLEPDATLLVKKKIFSSLGQYNDPDFMDKDEKMFLLASRMLFKNICRKIAAYEQLTKIENSARQYSKIDPYLLPALYGITNHLNRNDANLTMGNLINGITGQSSPLSTLTKLLTKIQQLIAFSSGKTVTTWLNKNSFEIENMFNRMTGDSGVIELTNFTRLSTTSTLDPASAPASIDIVDPYEYCKITQFDIEKAIADSFQGFKVSSFANTISSAVDTLNNIANLNRSTSEITLGQLNSIRKRRGVSRIAIRSYPFAVSGERINAYYEKRGITIDFTINGSKAYGSFDISRPAGTVEVPKKYILNTAENKDSTIGNDGFTSEELNIFKALILSANKAADDQVNAQSLEAQSNSQMNALRNKMQLWYLQDSIVQAQDEVRIYINSRAKADTRLFNKVQSTYQEVTFMQQAQDVTRTLDGITKMLTSDPFNDLSVEKQIFVGPEFPDELWLMFRNYFVNNDDGACVFAGIVNSSSSSYSSNSGSTINISCSSNMKYLEMGITNLNPGVVTTGNSIYDPLTPFKTDIDKVSTNKDIPELLDENKELLKLNYSNGNSTGAPVIKYKSGPLVGSTVSEANYAYDVSNKTRGLTSGVRRVFYAPDGFAHKWKEGICIATQDGYNDLESRSTSTPNVFKNLFAKQDIINSVSLYVTGGPYNYTTYYNNMKDKLSGGYQKDNFTFEDLTRDKLSSRNAIWGNFVPFKSLVVSEEANIKYLQGMVSIQKPNQELTNTLESVQKIRDQLAMNEAVYANDPSQPRDKIVQDMQVELKKLFQQADMKSREIVDIAAQNNISVNGSDFSQEMSDLNPENQELRRFLRRKVDFLTRRLSWQVRANEDKNLLIIDDSFDKDGDFTAFSQELSTDQNLATQSFETSVLNKITTMSKTFDLEFYCDTQGNLRLRMPQYNKMPKSVFWRMMNDSISKGIQTFPGFIQDMVKDQLQYYTDKLELAEMNIRLLGAYVGKNTDEDVTGMINGSFSASNGIFRGGKGGFTFLTTESAPFSLVGYDAATVFAGDDSQANPMGIVNSLTGSGSSDALAEQAELKNTFTTSAKVKNIKSWIEDSSNNAAYDKGYYETTRINELSNAIRLKSGKAPDRSKYVSTATEGGSSFTFPLKFAVNINGVMDELSSLIANRQKIVKLMNSALKNYKQSKSLQSNGNLVKTALYAVQSETTIPEVFESLLEDETFDDIGPNSGQRYIIRPKDILSHNISRQAPEFCAVNVTGRISPSMANKAVTYSSRYQVDPNDALMTATAIDYTTWNQFGFKQAANINIPFFSNTATQCGPYAAILLLRQRANIISGIVKVIGNEFYQPGDVVYIEHMGMLFYVHSVSHEFSFGTAFSTTLSLKYGHIPGHYIPNTFDMIGKVLYNKKYNGDDIIYRNEYSQSPEKPLGAFVLDSDPYGKLSAQNTKLLNKVLEYAAYITSLAKTPTKEKTVVKLELRTYKDPGINNSLYYRNLQAFKDAIVNALTVTDASKRVDYSTAGLKYDAANIDQNVEVEFSEEQAMSPSSMAISEAKRLAAISPEPWNDGDSGPSMPAGLGKSTDSIRTHLCFSIIDVYVNVKKESEDLSLGQAMSAAGKAASEAANIANSVGSVGGSIMNYGSR